MRFAIDTGGTFTDLLVEDEAGLRHMFKAPTTPDDPIRGLLDSLEAAAGGLGLQRRELLGRGRLLIHGTTHALNAVLTGRTARTALIVTAGHRDILVMREGGRAEPFNFERPFPPPYVPRSLTFEVSERIGVGGEIVQPLDEASLEGVIDRVEAAEVEAVAVCLLWSPADPRHELRIGERLAARLPHVAVTLSHRLNPILREYRRAIAAAIDASLKPIMADYMGQLEARLRQSGFDGRVLIATSQGGVMDAADAATAPIHIINSGPSAAPLAGAWFAASDAGAATAIVADTGGTTYDVAVVSGGQIAFTRNAVVGTFDTGFPSVDVKSIGAGGGSIAWVDRGGLLHVGPQSAGAVPGPAAYGRGGTRPTVTDASVVLGHLDPDYFLGGGMKLDRGAALEAVRREVAGPLGLSDEAAAEAILALTTETMVQAILTITVDQGIDPRSAVLVGGGGAAGLNSVRIARRLGCAGLLIPECGAALSAAGALMSDLKASFHRALPTHSARFDRAAVNAVLEDLEASCAAFATASGAGTMDTTLTFTAEARYANQVWDIDTALPVRRFRDEADEAAFREAFHAAHRRLFGMDDPGCPVEVVGWSATVSCRLDAPPGMVLAPSATAPAAHARPCWFAATGWTDAAIIPLSTLAKGRRISGPAVIESGFTAIVIDPGAIAERSPSGGLFVQTSAQDGRRAAA
jgi:N-methylhydantoinase A